LMGLLSMKYLPLIGATNLPPMKLSYRGRNGFSIPSVPDDKTTKSNVPVDKTTKSKIPGQESTEPRALTKETIERWNRTAKTNCNRRYQPRNQADHCDICNDSLDECLRKKRPISFFPQENLHRCKACKTYQASYGRERNTAKKLQPYRSRKYNGRRPA